MFKQICQKWFTPHVDLFATCLTQKVPTVHISTSRPTFMGDRCSEYKLFTSHCLCLSSYGSPSQGDPENKLMLSSLALGPSVALNRDPTSNTSVNNTFPKQSHNQVDFFMYLYQHLNRCPSAIDGYGNAVVDSLGPAGLHISQSSDLNRLLSSVHRDQSKGSRNLSK